MNYYCVKLDRDANLMSNRASWERFLSSDYTTFVVQHLEMMSLRLNWCIIGYLFENICPLVFRYCDCFASGLFCIDCDCADCRNNPENCDVREAALMNVLDRNSNALNGKPLRCPIDKQVCPSNRITLWDWRKKLEWSALLYRSIRLHLMLNLDWFREAANAKEPSAWRSTVNAFRLTLCAQTTVNASTVRMSMKGSSILFLPGD